MGTEGPRREEKQNDTCGQPEPQVSFFVISVVRFCKAPYGLIALLAYVVFDHTGIGRRHFTRDSQAFQQALNGMVSLLRLPCDDQTFGGEGNDMMCVNNHISFLLNLFEKHTDGRSGYLQIPGKVRRMNRLLL